jgi:hypothetical protein
MMGISSRWRLGDLLAKCWEVTEKGWYLGLTAFGGPPVHFKIVSETESLDFPLCFDVKLRN